MTITCGLSRTLPAVLVPAALLGAMTAAEAGGFGLREQSAYYQGSAFAGNAAGGAGLASMYWNPAALSFVPGLQAEGNVTYIAPHASIDVLSAYSALQNNLGTTGVDNIVDSAALPTGYVNYAWDRFAWGVSVTSPYGLVTDANCGWSGRYYGCYSRIFDVNMAAQVAYKVNNWLTIGGGLQANYMDARLSQAQYITGYPTFISGSSQVDGSSMAYGFTLGALLTLAPGTTLGVGYRSQLSQNLEGITTVYGPNAKPVAWMGAQADMTLPDQITASLRAKIDPQWTVLGTVEWTNWSTMQQLAIVSGTSVSSVLPMHWDDGWFFSGGLEYQWNTQLAVRAGLAYEISPVTDAYRTPRLPDSNRFWLSAGLTYAWTPQLSMDLAYTHIFGQSGDINQGPSDPSNLTRGVLVAQVDNAYVNIVSLGVRYRFDAPVNAPALITK